VRFSSEKQVINYIPSHTGQKIDELWGTLNIKKSAWISEC